MHLAGLGILVCLAALNGGSNSFFLFSSTLIGVALVSARRSRRWIEGLDVSAEVEPDGLFANRPGHLRLLLRSRIGPLRVGLSLPQVPTWVVGVACPAGTTITATVHPTARGRHAIGPVHALSRAPWGVAASRRTIILDGSLLVYPEPAPDVDPEVLLRSAPRDHTELPMGCLGDGPDFLGLRDYRPEDGLRRVHWPSFAKTGSLLSRLHEREEPRALTLHLNRYIPEDTGEHRDRFERSVSRITASVLRAHTLGLPFSLVMSELPPLRGRGPRQRHAALTALAEVTPIVGIDPRPGSGPGASS